ncbi:hypothetical protein ABVV53_16570 [Novosphingobium sp. RD2P27]|uniref:Argininosuccinate lyase n=1 Tax=Novosphingobium kalidii TaxID=3230299 RepID=A0ABV2D5B0_9SPHN
MRLIWIGLAGLLLGGCEKADNAPGPGGVTVGEARALDEAAQMIEARRPPSDTLRQTQPPVVAQAPEGDGGVSR